LFLAESLRRLENHSRQTTSRAGKFLILQYRAKSREVGLSSSGFLTNSQLPRMPFLGWWLPRLKAPAAPTGDLITIDLTSNILIGFLVPTHPNEARRFCAACEQPIPLPNWRNVNRGVAVLRMRLIFLRSPWGLTVCGLYVVLGIGLLKMYRLARLAVVVYAILVAARYGLLLLRGFRYWHVVFSLNVLSAFLLYVIIFCYLLSTLSEPSLPKAKS